jgi:hypothetical protein
MCFITLGSFRPDEHAGDCVIHYLPAFARRREQNANVQDEQRAQDIQASSMLPVAVLMRPIAQDRRCRW